jgi:cell division protein FtsA
VETPFSHNGKIITALDIGSSKIACFIAQVGEDRSIRIIGSGVGESRGIKNGQISSIDDAVKSIANVVSIAEDGAEMGSSRINKVVLSLSGLKTNSYNIVSEVTLNKSRPISYHDIRRAIKNVNYEEYLKENELIHNFPIEYRIDDSISTSSPQNLFGSKLTAVFHLITADPSPIKNLNLVLRSAYLEAETKVVAGYASGIGCLDEDEKDIGVVLIEIGGGNTTISTFAHSHLIDVKSIPAGGILITSDIAKGLAVSFKEAERIKTLHGSCIHMPSDDRESIHTYLAGEDDENKAISIVKSELVNIVRMRVKEIFELAYAYLERQNLLPYASKIVLTGGSSELSGIRELAHEVFGKNIRLAKPYILNGMPEITQRPAFSTLVGLLLYQVRERFSNSPIDAQSEEKKHGFFGRIWAKLTSRL